jgi:pimeloyl-ACP methyl ester carboxylesterase
MKSLLRKPDLAMRQTATYRRCDVTSADGTVVGYREMGRGPAVILLHGGMMTSQNFMRLGAALSAAFTVIMPDRRGRGFSGPFGENYGIDVECADIAALVERTGASNLFGLSSGAIIALFAGLALPGIRRVAAYEPPFPVNGFDTAHWAPRFDREIARGDLASAMITVLKGTGDSALLRRVPHFLLAPLVKAGIRANRSDVSDDQVPIEKLIPTMHFDALLVKETRGSVGKLGRLGAEVLLLGGSRSAYFLKSSLDVLSAALPRVSRVELRGVGHIAADNEGKPELVAASLQRFFARAAPSGTP